MSNTDAMSPRMKKKLGTYTAMRKKRAAGEALPNTRNIFKAPKYQPEPAASVRQGADDHRNCKSLTSGKP